MTLREAMHVFDEVFFDVPHEPEKLGTVRCCGIVVAMRRGSEVRCVRCNRAIVDAGPVGWIVSNWGCRGPKRGWRNGV